MTARELMLTVGLVVVGGGCGGQTQDPDASGSGGRGEATGGGTGNHGGDGAGGTGALAGGSAGHEAGGGTGGDGGSGGTPAFSGSANDGLVIPSGDALNATAVHLGRAPEGGVFIAGTTRSADALGAALPEGKQGVAFVGRLDSAGTPLFRTAVPDCGEVHDLTVAPDGAVWIVCPYMPGATSIQASLYSGAVLAVAVDGETGSIERSVDFVDAGDLIPAAIAVDAAGVVYVGSGLYPEGGGAFVEVSVVHRIDEADGVTSPWRSTGPDPEGTSYVSDLAVLEGGELVIVGSFDEWMQVGDARIDSEAVYEQWSTYNGYVGVLTESDSALSRFGGTVFDLGWAAAPLSGGDFVVGGMVSDAVDVGALELTGHADGSPFVAFFAAELMASGAHVFGAEGGAAAEGSVTSVAAGSSGRVHATGVLGGALVAVTYEPDGGIETGRVSVMTGETRGESIVEASDGALWVSGTFAGTVDLGTGPLSTDVGAFLLRRPALD